MLEKRRLVLLVAGMLLAGMGCGAEDDNGPGTSTPSGGGGTLGGTGGTAAAPSGGSGGGANDCPPWPPGQLFPYVGPWFYGPHPGPCTMLIGDASSPSWFLEFSYDAATGQLVGATGDSGETTYVWEDDLLVLEQAGSVDYEYVYETDLVRINQDGTPVYVYYLDSNGYPVDLDMDVDRQPGFDVRMRYNYVDCRIVSRSIVEITPAAEASASAFEKTVDYDAAGNLIGRYGTGDSGGDELFTYDCWQ